jgi:hypothetical protein
MLKVSESHTRLHIKFNGLHGHLELQAVDVSLALPLLPAKANTKPSGRRSGCGKGILWL